MDGSKQPSPPISDYIAVQHRTLLKYLSDITPTVPPNSKPDCRELGVMMMEFRVGEWSAQP